MGRRRLRIAAELAESFFTKGFAAHVPLEPMAMKIVDARVVTPFGERDLELLVESERFSGGENWADAEPIMVSFKRVEPTPGPVASGP